MSGTVGGLPDRGTVGLLGFGAFGRFAAPHLQRHFDVAVFDTRDLGDGAHRAGVRSVSLDEAAASPVVVLAVPVQRLEALLDSIRGHVRADALVVDVSSVKAAPIEMMLRLLPPTVAIVGTHPLFGPQSGKDGIAGLPVALCPARADDETVACVRDFLGKTLGLKVFETSAEEHDQQMAYVQALTHFVSRAVGGMDLPQTAMATRAYGRLLEMKADLEQDSMELFLTIERMNPFAKKAREELIRRLEELEKEIG